MSDLETELKKSKLYFARLADELFEKGEVDKAIELCEVGLRDYPAYSQAHFILGKCYLHKGMSEQARKEFERVLVFDSNHLAALNHLADIYYKSQLQDVYKDLLFKLNTLDPLNKTIRNKLKETGIYEQWLSFSESKSQPEIEKIDYPKPDNREVMEMMTQEDNTETAEPEEDKEAATPEAVQPIDLEIDKPETETIEEELKSENVEEFHAILEGIFNEAQRDKSDDEYDDDSFALDSDDIVNQVLTSNKNNEDESSDKEVDLHLEDIDVKIDERLDIEEEQQGEESETGDSAVDQTDKTGQIEKDLTEKIADIKDIETEEGESQAVYNGKIVSRTLGEILISQKKYAEAKKVFELLRQQQGENPFLDKKIEIIDQLISLSKE